MNKMSSISNLMNNLETLKLLKIKDNLNNYLDMISDGVKTPLDALNELVQMEINHRDDMAIISCVKVANFPFQRSINDFDFSFQPSLDKQKVLDLASLRFLERSENVIICGTPGVGKTHLAVAIGTEAAKQRCSVYCIAFHDLIAQLRKAKYENRLETRIKWFCRYKLLIVDELGYEKMDMDTANLFFNLIAKRYEKSSTIITTNIAFSKWPEVFGDPVLTNALLDRLLHHCSILNINGPSYRLKDQIQYMTDND